MRCVPYYVFTSAVSSPPSGALRFSTSDAPSHKARERTDRHRTNKGRPEKAGQRTARASVNWRSRSQGTSEERPPGFPRRRRRDSRVAGGQAAPGVAPAAGERQRPSGNPDRSHGGVRILVFLIPVLSLDFLLPLVSSSPSSSHRVPLPVHNLPPLIASLISINPILLLPASLRGLLLLRRAYPAAHTPGRQEPGGQRDPEARDPRRTS